MLPSFEDVTLSIPRPHVLLVTLNKPDKRNAVNSAMDRHLVATWDFYEKSDDLWCCVVTGAGSAFCAGLDLAEIARIKSVGQAADRLFGGFAGLTFKSGLNKPIIAAVNGPAYGGGFELVLACDIILSSTDAQFGLWEVKRGIAPISGGAVHLPRVIGYHNAMLVMLTGRNYTATEMKDFGLVQTIVEPESLLNTALALAEEIAGNSPDGVRVAKACAKVGLELGWDRANVDALLVPEVAAMFAGSNIREGVRAFKEKRPPSWSPPLDTQSWTVWTMGCGLWSLSKWAALTRGTTTTGIFVGGSLAAAAVALYVAKTGRRR
ncbi:enoyl-CoA hydratase/isomerase family protein [Gonapodya prolifera JEL478]|uniref:Enoyl-CoA hydratase/isomerase family protein n=1 Tax=Gonapodya prolifera (strain JEL478) TaxID=1344416 RepID=A0A139AUS3_GONPJ|nr:enoyl-CoA hydratase/isomerase family protein [Gonapodya prolifera JEL478]|eukprot:KXS20468.1 enoyl-CoA hydratase/isomerase family protein [Gonapodya prolifera JEL478]